MVAAAQRSSSSNDERKGKGNVDRWFQSGYTRTLPTRIVGGKGEWRAKGSKSPPDLGGEQQRVRVRVLGCVALQKDPRQRKSQGDLVYQKRKAWFTMR